MYHYSGIRFFAGGLFSVCLLMMAPRLFAQPTAEQVRLDQTGFYPAAQKIAILPGRAAGPFYLLRAGTGDTVYTGQSGKGHPSMFSDRTTRTADFSAFTDTGNYRLYIPSVGYSCIFAIRPAVHRALVKATLKGYYYQRCSMALLPAYAGRWGRPEGHPDTTVLVHSSAAGPRRPAGTVVSSPGGWYDAGDYNKYIVNCGITMGTLLSAYEDFPDYFDHLRTNIPETGNGLPDLLNEALWNLRWMLTMQDPADGGVYHKLTHAAFSRMVMPAAATAPRYMVQKGTAATLDFAAVMAQAARVLRKFSRELPGLPDSCLAAARRAWAWAQKNPGIVYDQPALNRQFDPDITTGAYGDRHLDDERAWAAIELYVTTREDGYYRSAALLADSLLQLPSWSQVRLLGYYTLARNRHRVTPLAEKDLPVLKDRLLQFCDRLLAGAQNSPYGTVMGASARDFIWGSNAVAANEGVALVQAYRLTHERKYLAGALGNLGYLLGRNGTGYCFVTGLGARPPMHPHHRPSIADGIPDPVPGLLVGGPNPGRQDHCNCYPSGIPDESYADDDRAYACNEIAINWNAPLVYLSGALEALENNL